MWEAPFRKDLFCGKNFHDWSAWCQVCGTEIQIRVGVLDIERGSKYLAHQQANIDPQENATRRMCWCWLLNQLHFHIPTVRRQQLGFGRKSTDHYCAVLDIIVQLLCSIQLLFHSGLLWKTCSPSVWQIVLAREEFDSEIMANQHWHDKCSWKVPASTSSQLRGFQFYKIN